ncbi:MAG: hypothetical protein AAF620_16065, partial [Bacteroidota bacterium]
VADGQIMHDFGDLKSGERSDYVEFENAYRYAYVELMIDTVSFYIQPFDFVGEEKLKAGRYTYQLNATDSNSPFCRLSMDLRND